MKTMILVFLAGVGATAILVEFAALLRRLAISCHRRGRETEIRHKIAELERLLARHHQWLRRQSDSPSDANRQDGGHA